MAKRQTETVSAVLQPEPNRLIKNNLFVALFQEKKDLLDLYNGVNGTAYTNPDDLQINTLENAVFMKMKNDLSFIFRFEMSVYEHQSTINPNMPLRDLFYVDDLLKGMIAEEDVYRKKLIRIPVPRFVVFYNGQEALPEKSVLKLSDAFEKPTRTPELELKVTVYNVNYGFNKRLMKKCQRLHDYSWFISRIRENLQTGMEKNEAVTRAINEAIRHDILADYLKKHRAEVMNMTIYEYDEEQHLKTVHDEGYEEAAEKFQGQLEEKDRLIAEKDAEISDLKAKLAAAGIK